MKLEVINPLEYAGWDELVLETQKASSFHSSGWAGVMQGSYDYLPAYFTLTEGGRIRALMPVVEVRSLITGTRGVSLAFTDYCEPIVEDAELFRQLFDRVVEFGKCRGWKYLELRGGESYLPEAQVYRKYFGHILQLEPDPQVMLGRFRDSTRRNINRAVNEGVQVSVSTTLEATTAFYRLHCLTRKRQGLPPQPFSFFRNIHRFLLSRGHGQVVLGAREGRVLAGAVIFHFGGRALYKFGASDLTFQDMRPNNLVIWEGIRWCAEHGMSSFCFGKTDLDNDGLRQFKNGWGAREGTICYFRYDLGREAFQVESSNGYRRGSLVFRNLPQSVLIGIGSLLYKHVG